MSAVIQENDVPPRVKGNNDLGHNVQIFFGSCFVFLQCRLCLFAFADIADGGD